MKITKKTIEERANRQGYSFYDYFIDDMHTENKYYLRNNYTRKIQGFNKLTYILDYLDFQISKEISNILEDNSIEYTGGKLYRIVNGNNFYCNSFSVDEYLHLSDFEQENYIFKLEWNLF